MNSLIAATSTIAEAEELIQNGLECLREAPMNDLIASALSFVAPVGYRIVVQLEEEGRKKRSTASISNWNHATGEIVMYFEPVTGEASRPLGLPLGNAAASAAPRLVKPVSDPDAVALMSPVSTTQATTQGVTPEQEVRECCEALAEAEKQGKHFYAIKWFRDTFLQDKTYSWTDSVSSRQRVLNHAIQEGLIETHTVPNPKNPAFPTTALQLNRQKAVGVVAPRFRPVSVVGEPLSQTILNDRGSR